MRIFLILFVLVILACNSPSGSSDGKGSGKIYSIESGQGQSDQITCWGIGDIDLDNDAASLQELAGKEKLSFDSLMIEGTFNGFNTKIWKGTNREVVVHWKEKKLPCSSIDYLEISASQSPYHFANGIKIGSRLSEIVKLNGGKAIHLYGFGWDNGGTFIDFNKGKLAGDIPCFGGIFSLPKNLSAADINPVLGDKKISSQNPVLMKYDPVLTVIRVRNY